MADRGHVKVGAGVDEIDWLVGCHFDGGGCGGLIVLAGGQDERIGIGLAERLAAGGDSDVSEGSGTAPCSADEKAADLLVKLRHQLPHVEWRARAARSPEL